MPNKLKFEITLEQKIGKGQLPEEEIGYGNICRLEDRIRFALTQEFEKDKYRQRHINVKFINCLPSELSFLS